MNFRRVSQFIFQRDYFTDRSILLLFVAFSSLFMFTTLYILMNVDPSSPISKTGFNDYGVGKFTRSEGYALYKLAVFSVVSYLAILAVSIKTYNLRKSIAATGLFLGAIIMIMLFLTARALFTA